MEAKHTPTPWVAERVDPQQWRIDAPNGDGTLRMAWWTGLADVFGCDDQPHLGAEVAAANADFIVRACNSHDALVEALKWYVRNDDTNDGPENAFWLAGKAAAIEALALAGETP